MEICVQAVMWSVRALRSPCEGLREQGSVNIPERDRPGLWCSCHWALSRSPVKFRSWSLLSELRRWCRAFVCTPLSRNPWMQAAQGEQGSPLWLRAVPGEEVDCEASADSPSSRGNRGAACRGICSHSDAMSRGEMAGVDWSTWRKEFSTSVPLPPEGRSRSGEWCVSTMRGGEQEWGRWCYLPLPLPSMLGWITKSLGKRGRVDSDFVSLSGRGWLMGNLSHSFPLKKISCPFSWKLK